MAKPQLEDGHTKIANEIVDVLAKVNLSAYESRLLWCIFRKTYGWNKKSDRISYSQFEESTGLDRRHIGRTLKILISRRMITCQGEGQQLEYAIQKDYDQWAKPLPKEATKPLPIQGATAITNSGNGEQPQNHCLFRAELLPIQDASLPKEATKPLPKEANTKDIKHITKALDKRHIEQNLKLKFGEFNNVLLTSEEHEKLVTKFGQKGADEKIENISGALASKGLKYLSHYATILNWSRRDGRKNGQSERDSKAWHQPERYTRPDELSS